MFSSISYDYHNSRCPRPATTSRCEAMNWLNPGAYYYYYNYHYYYHYCYYYCYYYYCYYYCYYYHYYYCVKCELLRLTVRLEHGDIVVPHRNFLGPPVRGHAIMCLQLDRALALPI